MKENQCTIRGNETPAVARCARRNRFALFCLIAIVTFSLTNAASAATNITGQAGAESGGPWALSTVNSQGAINANNAALDAAFLWLRQRKMNAGDDNRRVALVFPPGIFYLSESFSPSGKNDGPGLIGGQACLFEFSDTTFRFTGAATNYEPVQIPFDATTWLPLDSYHSDPTEPYWSGSQNGVTSDIVEDETTSYRIIQRRVAFNIRNSGDLKIIGDLRLERVLPSGTTKSDRLVAVTSSGGNKNLSGPGSGRSGMQRGSIESIEIDGFNTAIFAERFDTNSQLASDTFTSVSIGNLAISNCYRALFLGGNHFDGVNIRVFDGEAEETSYLHGVHAVNVETATLRSNVPATGPTRKPKFLEVSKSEVHFGRLTSEYKNADNRAFSSVNAANMGTVVIDEIAKLASFKPLSGSFITAAQFDREDVLSNTSKTAAIAILRIFGSEAAKFSLVGLSSTTAATTNPGKHRRIRQGDLDAPFGVGRMVVNTQFVTNADKLIPLINDFYGTAANKDRFDKIWFNTNLADEQYYKIGFNGTKCLLVTQGIQQ